MSVCDESPSGKSNNYIFQKVICVPKLKESRHKTKKVKLKSQ